MREAFPTDAARVTRAGPDDLPRIENLMQFYNYDLSEDYPVEFAEHGLYALRPKQAYWAQPTVVPYLLRVAGHLAGFAVVDQEVVEPSSTYSLGYFYVARRYRGQGLGLPLAATVMRQHPGRWEVYHLARNRAAQRFWPRVLPQLASTPLEVSDRVIDELPSTLYRFAVDPPLNS